LTINLKLVEVDRPSPSGVRFAGEAQETWSHLVWMRGEQSEMNEIMTRPDAALILDAPRRWAVDGALLGAVAGVSSPALMLVSEPLTIETLTIVAALTACGALTGVVYGFPVRRLLNWLRRRLSLRSLAVLMPAVGAIWGTGVITGAMVLIMIGGDYTLAQIAGASIGHGVIIGGPIGAVLFGLLWLPYAVTAVMRLSRWPVVLATAALSPVLTWIWLTLLQSH